MPKTIAVIDDEDDIRSAVKRALEKEGYAVMDFACAEDFFSRRPERVPDLFILDIMLPGTDGFEICRKIRSDGATALTPVIFLSARSDVIDRIVGLELGADDYMTKPFSLKELAARVKARLRRADKPGEIKKAGPAAGGLTLYEDNLEVCADGKKIQLTGTEFRILQLLYTNCGRAFPRNRILEYVWGGEKEVFDRTIDVHIKNLREKIGRYGKNIKNIRSVGYKYEE